ncbi:LacI family DNA-binding transcriptional regulator [soil metagenome]
MAATIKDIAKRLNISTSTVSYALNGGPRAVPEAVRQRVVDLARELDYRPNHAARSLVTRRTNTVGIVPPSTETNVFLSPFVRLAWNALVNEAEALEQDLLLFSGHNRNLPDEHADKLLDGRIDAVVFIAPREDARAIPFLSERNFPHTAVSSSALASSPRFGCDNRGGVQQAIDHLRDLGHHRIAHAAGSPDAPDGVQRAVAFCDILEEAGLPVSNGYVQPGDFTTGSGFQAGLRLLALPERPTAVFAGNDEMAYGLCQAFREAGLSVPGDISVVGFDDADLSYAFNPPITTVQQPLAAMASAALRGAVDLANGTDRVAGAEFATKLIVRGSTAPLTEVAR